MNSSDVKQGQQSEPELTVANEHWFNDEPVRAVYRALNRNGHEARIVGGALRNALMGLPIGDIDFATTTTPEETIALAEEAGFKTFATGLQHGTVTLVVNAYPFEVTTLRHDVESHGRHATVAFTRDWAADAKRRDFTMNALYADADGRVIDPLGGYEDLRKRHVRFIGSAKERIREDYLRILRFFRFAAEYGDEPLDAEGLSACIEERHGLAKLSAERIHMELLRILGARTPRIALEPMAESGLLGMLLGGVARLSHFARLVEIEAGLNLAPDDMRRLAALALMVDEDAARLSGRLRLSNAESGRLMAMAAHQPQLHPDLEPLRVKEQLYRLGNHAFEDRVLIAWARSGGTADDKKWQELMSWPQRWSPPDFPVTGGDLLAVGVPKGPRIGMLLRKLETRWIASDFALNREKLLETILPL